MTNHKPNILIIGVDSLRAPNLSCYGYPRLTSPHIDQLASQGTLFENTFSAHIPTTSGYTSMMSGLRRVLVAGSGTAAPRDQ